MDSETSMQQHSIKNEVSVRVDEGIDLSEKLLKQHQGAATIKKYAQIGLPVDYTKMGQPSHDIREVTSGQITSLVYLDKGIFATSSKSENSGTI